MVRCYGRFYYSRGSLFFGERGCFLGFGFLEVFKMCGCLCYLVRFFFVSVLVRFGYGFFAVFLLVRFRRLGFFGSLFVRVCSRFFSRL